VEVFIPFGSRTDPTRARGGLAASPAYIPAVAADDPGDVQSPIDLRDPVDAGTWAREADVKRPWRDEVRGAFAALVSAASLPVRRVLELGSGPGLLAERILRCCAVERYTLLDFSPSMLELSRARIGDHPAAVFVLGDFKQPGWAAALDVPFDAVVTMQAVHEVRHKRHVPELYRKVAGTLRSGGMLLVCDHVPPDATARMTALHSTEAEQHAALIAAGFVDVTTHALVRGLYLCLGRRAG
jgi:SAM-dependent methyltransferase